MYRISKMNLELISTPTPPPKIHDLLNKELSAAIKRRFENLSLSMSVLMQCTLYIRLYVKAQA